MTGYSCLGAVVAVLRLLELPLISLLGNRNLFGNGDVEYLSKLPLIMENIKAGNRISDQNELSIY